MQKSKINMEILNQEELDGLISKAQSYGKRLKNTVKDIQNFEYEIDFNEAKSRKGKYIVVVSMALCVLIAGVIRHERKNNITGKWSDGPTLHADVPKSLRRRTSERFI